GLGEQREPGFVVGTQGGGSLGASRRERLRNPAGLRLGDRLGCGGPDAGNPRPGGNAVEFLAPLGAEILDGVGRLAIGLDPMRINAGALSPEGDLAERFYRVHGLELLAAG